MTADITHTHTHTQTDTLITILQSPIGGRVINPGITYKHKTSNKQFNHDIFPTLMFNSLTVPNFTAKSK